MRLDLSCVCLLLSGAVSFAAIAQDHSPFLKQLDAKSAQMKRCADLARALEKIPVPPQHAEAKAAIATHALLKTPPMVDPVHANFEMTVKRMDQDFMRCGDELFKDLGQVEAKIGPFMAELKKQKPADAQQKAISQSMVGYMKAKHNLHEAVELLSKDIQMQAYVHKTLMEHYLNQKY